MRRTLPWKKKTTQAESGDFPLQITSLADVFTILLVFLLKSYASSAAFIQPGPGLHLPQTRAAASVPPDALRVEVSPTGILVDGKFTARSTELGEDRRKILETLQLSRKRQEYLRERNPELKEDRRILFIADRNLTYEALRPLLSLASQAGYGEFRFVVHSEN
jgi:biopolymer transport protein ExbD